MDSERYKQIWISVFIAAILFATGFYAGKRSSLEIKSAQFLNATSTDKVDMTAFWKAWSILDDKFVSVSSTTLPVRNQDKLWNVAYEVQLWTKKLYGNPSAVPKKIGITGRR